MLTFEYSARNTATGQKVKSEIQAENVQTAAKYIKQQGLAPLNVSLKGGQGNGIGNYFNRVKSKDKVLFSRQMSTLLNAGLPLVQSLRSVSSQTSSKPLKLIVTAVISDVEAGSALSVALAKYPDVFNQVYIGMIGAGEVSGTLDQAMDRLAVQQEKDSEIISKVRGAMIYPAIVLLVMFVVMGFMLVAVLPQVEDLYAGLPGTSLPLLTRVLLAISGLIVRFWWIVLTFVVFVTIFTSRYARTLGGKRIIDRFKMRAWPIGRLFMKMYMARFARTGATLVASGVPLLQTLEITANAVNNYHISGSIHNAMDKVRGGKALSESLQGDPNFLELVPNMLSIGEQSGSIEQMLGKTADYYEHEVDNEIKAVSTIIEPVLMVVLGIVAFIIVAAVLLPIYGLAGKTIIK